MKEKFELKENNNLIKSLRLKFKFKKVIYGLNVKIKGKEGLLRESNPRPPVPETRIIPLDQAAGTHSSDFLSIFHLFILITSHFLLQISFFYLMFLFIICEVFYWIEKYK